MASNSTTSIDVEIFGAIHRVKGGHDRDYLEQLAAIRRRTALAIAGAVAAGCLLAVTLGDRPADPPVHLEIRVVGAGGIAAETPAPQAETAPEAAPLEFDRP